MTHSKPIKVKESLNKFNTPVATKLIIKPTSLPKLVINFPECLLSIS